MASVNKVILVGNLGRDPEVRFLPSGEAVANLNLATTDTWKDKAGEKQESTEWHRISFFGRQAEVCQQYLSKGSQIYVEGSLRTRKWQDKEGQERTTTEIRGDRMQMLGGKSGSNASGGDSAPSPQRNAQGAPRSTNDFEDDIPFASIGKGIGGHAI